MTVLMRSFITTLLLVFSDLGSCSEQIESETLPITHASQDLSNTTTPASQRRSLREQQRTGRFTRIFDTRPFNGASNLSPTIEFRADVSNFLGVTGVKLFLRSQTESNFREFGLSNSGNRWSRQIDVGQTGVSYRWFLSVSSRFGGLRETDVFEFSVVDGRLGAPASPGGGTSLRLGIQPSCFEIDLDRFNICLDLSLTNQNRLAAFQRAKNKWEAVIVGQNALVGEFGPLIKGTQPQGVVWATDVPTLLDDLYIAAFEEPIDGNGRILGMSGPQFKDGEGRPVNGIMTFDSTDIERLLNEDPQFWENIVIHEMAHILGIGTVWDQKGLRNGSNYIGGTRVQKEWEALGCQGFVPIETDGGPDTPFLGTAFGHWDENCLLNELMTGFLNQGVNPLSRITIASLEDLGYSVSYSAADPFSLANINTNVCCFPDRRRELRGKQTNAKFDNGLQRQSDTGVSERIAQIAARFAARKMRRLLDDLPPTIPEGLTYVGGEFLTVLIYDDDENIRDLSFRWEDVKDLI